MANTTNNADDIIFWRTEIAIRELQLKVKALEKSLLSAEQDELVRYELLFTKLCAEDNELAKMKELYNHFATGGM